MLFIKIQNIDKFLLKQDTSVDYWLEDPEYMMCSKGDALEIPRQIGERLKFEWVMIAHRRTLLVEEENLRQIVQQLQRRNGQLLMSP
jgi:predicted RNase H-like nuclease